MEEANWPERVPILETERLILRELNLQDAEDMFVYASDPLVARYTTWERHESVETTREMIKEMVGGITSSGIISWGIQLKSTGKLIGHYGLFARSLEDRRAEIAYALAQPYWQQGYITEATLAVIDYSFRVCHLNRIEARCEPDNIASARVMEKAGMQYEGLLRQIIFDKGQFHDLKLYSILRQDWLKSAPNLVETGDLRNAIDDR